MKQKQSRRDQNCIYVYKCSSVGSNTAGVQVVHVLRLIPVSGTFFLEYLVIFFLRQFCISVC